MNPSLCSSSYLQTKFFILSLSRDSILFSKHPSSSLFVTTFILLLLISHTFATNTNSNNYKHNNNNIKFFFSIGSLIFRRFLLLSYQDSFSIINFLKRKRFMILFISSKRFIWHGSFSFTNISHCFAN